MGMGSMQYQLFGTRKYDGFYLARSGCQLILRSHNAIISTITAIPIQTMLIQCIRFWSYIA